MSQDEIEIREIRLLKYYVLFQFSIYFLSLIIRDFIFPGGSLDSVNWLRFIPAAVFLGIFIVLGLDKVKKNLTKPRLLSILVLLSITTILTRFITPGYSVAVDRARLFPRIFNGGVFNFGFDQIFFLILPVLFVAWQFPQKTMFLFCGFITWVEISISLLTAETDTISFFILIITILFRGVIFVIMGFFINGMSEVQRSQKLELEKVNARLRKSAIYNEQLAQSRERNRLARELHDTLAHTLSSTAVQLEAVKALYDTNPAQAKIVLEQSLENTRNGLNETRRALKDLRTSELENYGLYQSIKNLLISGAERSGFTYHDNLVERINLIPDQISHVIYRSIQEAIENTVKHARANHVELQLNMIEKSIQIKYTDDGQGFSTGDLGDIKHYGLQGMQERIELAGGKINIQSEPGRGTQIEINLELYDD